ncbi:MAG: NuA4 histone H4 acetyltransferase complex and the SWR1 complex subunit [Trizodia sp. TS-e1964]|nr:MAG: NuA4 histone H4 acetyltransferase complex and the SWR1 complex subunit [Trizodia sp. TS-e1964]
MAPPGNKRVKGVSIYRPFIFGSKASPIDPLTRPAHLPPDHTHQWTVFVKGIDNEDISYWLSKVQFKLHETYVPPLRTILTPPFEVTETGWGEFELSIKLYFVPESTEKPQTLWHALKLHPYGPDAEAARAARAEVVAQNYEEVVFNEPVEAFFDVLTGGGQKGGGKRRVARTAEVPGRPSPGNPYSLQGEEAELGRLKAAAGRVEEMVEVERRRLVQRESELAALRGGEGGVVGVKK